ncbi:hypothetical protein KGO95_03520 [Patescibacteria group bacterium]|nr:hypothetical protein [Patescibacteria group bacterium]
MTLTELRENWRHLFIVEPGIGGTDLRLKDVVRECIGEHRGGLLFSGTGSYADEMLTLRCDDAAQCFRRIRNTGDDDLDWELFGHLVCPMGRFSF